MTGTSLSDLSFLQSSGCACPATGAPFRWARPGKEKANQENLCCTEKDGMCPFLSQFYNIVYMETYSIFAHHPIILKEQLFPLLPFL